MEFGGRWQWVWCVLGGVSVLLAFVGFTGCSGGSNPERGQNSSALNHGNHGRHRGGSAPIPQMCRNHDLKLVAPEVAGIEQTGPKFDELLVFERHRSHRHEHHASLSRSPSDEILVSQLEKAVALSGLAAAASPSGNLEACDENNTGLRKHDVPLYLQSRPRPWALGSIGKQHYVEDFAVVAFGSVTGLRSVEGSLAAGGTILLDHFSINPQKHQRVALVGGGDVSLTHGRMFGEIHHGGALTRQHTVHVGSVSAVNPIPFQTLERRLKELSRALFDTAADGKVLVDDRGDIALKGSSRGVNIITLDAHQLERARRLDLRVPRHSGLVINVRGSEVALMGLSVKLHGLEASDVLWNFAASTLQLGPGRFQGTFLAPNAEVHAKHTKRDAAEVQGSVIAGSVRGQLSVHWVPLAHWEQLPFAKGVEAVSAVGLFAGCDYTLTLADDVPLDARGSCLADPVTIPVRVWRNQEDAVAAEIDSVLYAPVDGDPTALRLKLGTRVPAERFFKRFQSVFNLRPEVDEFRFDPNVELPPLEDQPDGRRVFYQQYFRGYPVLGHGYALTLDAAGNVVSALGGMKPLLALPADEPLLSRSAARELAATALPLSPTELANDGLWIVTGDPTTPRAEQFAWSFHDVLSPRQRIGINANDGSVEFRPAVFGFGGSAPLDGVAYSGQEQLETVQTRWHGPRLISLSLLSSAEDPETPFYSFAGTTPGVRTHNVTQQELGGVLAPSFRTATTRGLPGGLTDTDAQAVRSVHAAARDCVAYFEGETGGILGADALNVHMVEDWQHLTSADPRLRLMMQDDVDQSFLGFYTSKLPGAIFVRVTDEASWQLDVVCHEYVHALVDFWHPGAFQSGNPEQDTESKAIDEGTAGLMSTIAELRVLDPNGDWNTRTHGSGIMSQGFDVPGFLQYCPSASIPGCAGSRWLRIKDTVDVDLRPYAYGVLIGTWGYLVTVGTGGQPLQNDLGCSHEVLPVRGTFGESSTLLNQLLQATFTEYPASAPLDVPHFAQATFDMANAKYDATTAASVLQAWAVKNVSVFPQRAHPLQCPKRKDGTPASKEPKAAWAPELCWPVDSDQTAWNATITDPAGVAVATNITTSEFIQAEDDQFYARATVPVALSQESEFVFHGASTDSCSNRSGVFSTDIVEVALHSPQFQGDADTTPYWVFGTFGGSAGQCSNPFECSPGDMPPSPAPVGPVWDAVPGADHYRLRVSSVDNPTCSLSADDVIVPTGTGPEVTCLPGTCLPAAQPTPATNFLQIQPVHATGILGQCRSFPFEQIDGFELRTIVAQPGNVTLEWSPVGDETNYEVSVYAVGAQAPLFPAETTTGTSLSVPLSEGFYTWQVTALLEGGTRVPSPLQTLTVAVPIEIVDEAEKLANQPLAFSWNQTSADQFLIEIWAEDPSTGMRVLQYGPAPLNVETAGDTHRATVPVEAFARRGSFTYFAKITARYDFPGASSYVQHSDETSFRLLLTATITSPAEGSRVDPEFNLQFEGQGADEYVISLLYPGDVLPRQSFTVEGDAAGSLVEIVPNPYEDDQELRIQVVPRAAGTSGVGDSVSVHTKTDLRITSVRHPNSGTYCGDSVDAHFEITLAGSYPELIGFDYLVTGETERTDEIAFCDNPVRFEVGPVFPLGITFLYVEPISDPPDFFLSFRKGVARDFETCGELNQPCCADGSACGEGECLSEMCRTPCDGPISAPSVQSAGIPAGSLVDNFDQNLISRVASGEVPQVDIFSAAWTNVGADSYELVLFSQACPNGLGGPFVALAPQSLPITDVEEACTATSCGVLLDSLTLTAANIQLSCRGIYGYAVKAICGGQVEASDLFVVQSNSVAEFPIE